MCLDLFAFAVQFQCRLIMTVPIVKTYSCLCHSFYRSGSLFLMCDRHLINQWWSNSVWEHLHVFIRWNCWLKLQKLLKNQTPLKFFCKLQFGRLLQWNLVEGWWHLYKLMDRHNCMCQQWKWYQDEKTSFHFLLSLMTSNVRTLGISQHIIF